METGTTINYSERISSLSSAINKLQRELNSIKAQQQTNTQSIRSNLTEININKKIESYWTHPTDGSRSYDPQLPLFLNRKNQSYDYLVKSLVVTRDTIESELNSLGNDGWRAVDMSAVDESDGKSTFTFEKLESSTIKFNYTCFQFENAAHRRLQELMKHQNDNGYNFTAYGIFNKSTSFCLMTKLIY
jgi:hypothetical protein